MTNHKTGCGCKECVECTGCGSKNCKTCNPCKPVITTTNTSPSGASSGTVEFLTPGDNCSVCGGCGCNGDDNGGDGECPDLATVCPAAGKYFEWVDVFAEEPFQGNQLKVVLDCNACLTTEQMQLLAREFGGSETAYVLSSEPVDGMWPVRFFTPTTELAGAGHPSLGTASVIRERFLCNTVDEIILNVVGCPDCDPPVIGVGAIPVNFEGEGDTKVPFLTSEVSFCRIADDAEIAELEAVFGLPAGGIVNDPSTPVQIVAGLGLAWYMIPISSLALLQSIPLGTDTTLQNNEQAFTNAHPFSNCPGAPADFFGLFYLFTTQDTVDPDVQVHIRAFAGPVGVPEDPATGSGGAAFSAYAAEYDIFGSPVVNAVGEQGIEIGRPSIINFRADASAGTPTEGSVGGNIINVLKGTVNIFCDEPVTTSAASSAAASRASSRAAKLRAATAAAARPTRKAAARRRGR